MTRDIRFPKGYHNVFGKLLRFIGDFWIKYDQAYQIGVVDGMDRTNYYKGYSQGMEDGMKLANDSHYKFIAKHYKYFWPKRESQRIKKDWDTFVKKHPEFKKEKRNEA